MIRNRWLSWLAVILLLRTACERAQTVTVLRDQTWQVDHEFTYDPSGLAQTPIPIPLPDGGSVSLPAMTDDTMKGMLDRLELAFQTQGIKVTRERWTSGKEVTHRMTLKGRDLQILADWGLLGDPESILRQIVDPPFDIRGALPQKHVSVAMEASGQIRIVDELPFWPTNQMPLKLIKHTLRLRADKVTRANTIEIDSGVATWVNPARVEVVFEPQSCQNPLQDVRLSMPLVMGLGIALVAVLILVAGLVWAAKPRRGPRRSVPVRTYRRR